MSDATTVFVLLGVVIVLFVWNRLPVELVAIGAALSLWATGILDVQQALGGFGDPTVIFIASLFVVSEALDATGVTTWAGQQLIPRVGNSRAKLLMYTTLMVAFLTALISVNGAVAALLPMVVVLAIRLHQSPSLVMIPLAFGAHAGSMLALTGTPVNVLVSEAADEATGKPFGFFEFTLVGVPLVIGTVLIMVFLAPRLLPSRTGRNAVNLSEHALTLAADYRLDEAVLKFRVESGSPLAGQMQAALDLTAYPGAVLVGVTKPGGGPPGRPTIEVGDILLVRIDAALVDRFVAEQRVTVGPPADHAEVADSLLSTDLGVVELVVRPRSNLIGQHVSPGMLTDSGQLVILAIQRNGTELCTGEVALAAGDALLVQGSWEALDLNTADPDVLVVDVPQLVRRQAVPLGPRSTITIIVLVVMVFLLATDLVPPAIAGLLAAVALVLFGVVTTERAYRAISWTTVILVGGMIPLSTAIQTTGAAEKVANALIDIVGDSGPYALIAGLFVMTAVLGQLISNTATALVVIPIAVSAATELDVSPRPVLMSVTIAAAASFLTPVATPANLMVMGPGGYKFSDYWKLGLPVMLLFFVVATFLVPVFWHF